MAGFTSTDDLERWAATEPGIPVTRLMRGEVHAGTGVRSMIFDGAIGRRRIDLDDFSGRLAAARLDLPTFQRLVSQRMGWETRDGCQDAQLLAARIRNRQPLTNSEYEAACQVLDRRYVGPR
jgi:hypothetical protein